MQNQITAKILLAPQLMLIRKMIGKKKSTVSKLGAVRC